jgi:hypothetical protein
MGDSIHHYFPIDGYFIALTVPSADNLFNAENLLAADEIFGECYYI